MDQENINSEGLSRRDLLRRGAALGGALAWATPVVQVIGMSPALATAPSPVDEQPCVDFVSYQAKAEWNGSAWVWESEGGNSPQCGGCGNPGVDGSSYLTVTGSDTSAEVCPKPDVIIQSISAGAGSEDCNTGSASGNGCYSVSGNEPALSNIIVCFKVCVDE